MEWFKHKTGSIDDPDINELMDRFGDSGYMMFFGILEIYGREYKDTDADGFLSINLAFVSRKLRKTSAKVQSFLSHCQTLKRFEYSIVGKKLLIRIPSFIDISSNWTKRPKHLPTEVPTEVPTAKEVEEEVEEEKETKKKVRGGNSYSQQFLEFYQVYPNKTAKAEAFKAWKRINGKAELLPLMLQSIKEQTAHKIRLKERDEFCPEWPNPSTWLNQERWEDEVREHEKESLADYAKRMNQT